MQWLKKIILITAIIAASLYMASVGFLTYLFSSTEDEPQEQEQISEQAAVSENPATAPRDLVRQ
jgi:flagellar basal body-associated protein FliL